MARQEHDREDLLAEAKALVERVSLRIAGHDDEIVVGFRRDSSASFYFGGQRVYQFTSQGQLRRAFVDGLLFKAERGQLVSLRRQRTERAVELARHVLDEPRARLFLGEMRRHVELLRDALANNSFSALGQVPAGADVVGRVRRWLDEFAAAARIARSPRAG